MNIKRVIKEEIDDFQWMRDIEPVESIDLTGKWIIENDIKKLDSHMVGVQEKLFDLGFSWRSGSTDINTTDQFNYFKTLVCGFGHGDRDIIQKTFTYSGTNQFGDNDSSYYGVGYNRINASEFLESMNIKV
jgi:hypothetical protein